MSSLGGGGGGGKHFQESRPFTLVEVLQYMRSLRKTFPRIQAAFLPFLPNEEKVSHPVNACMEKREGEWHKSWAPSQTIVIACLIMATVCALSRNNGNSAIIAAGRVTVSWMSACKIRIPNSLCPTDAGSFQAISAFFQVPR